MHDSLGDRMKARYEHRTRYHLGRRTYTLIRVDGKAFHAYTRGCERPFDRGLMEAMDLTAKALCEQVEGARLAYVQSDEISVLLTDFETDQTEAWFDGNLQKIVSISASIATAAFNQARLARLAALAPVTPELLRNLKWAQFDSRAFQIADPVEVVNYFVWRQQDATRNSISMAAQAQFPARELEGVSSDRMQEKLFTEKGINWNDYPEGFKRGRCVTRETTTRDVVYTDKRTGEERRISGVTRHVWEIAPAPVFTRDRAWLEGRIPRMRTL